MNDAQVRFDDICDALTAWPPNVRRSKVFGMPCLKRCSRTKCGRMYGGKHLGMLSEPAPRLGVAVDADVPATFQHDFEVVPVDGLVGPPAVDDAPLLTNERNLLAVDDMRRSARRRLDECGPRGIEAPR